jgi:hypothetical protein
MKNERDSTSRDATACGVTQLNSPPSDNANGQNYSRRGFLGRFTATLATAFAGIWSLTSPKRAGADASPQLCTLVKTAQSAPTPNEVEPVCGPPPPPPPPVNYSTQSEALVNNLVAAFNDHDASGTAAYFDNAGVDTSMMETHLTNAFTSMPTLACTVTSMTVGPYGEYVTLDYSLAGEYQVRVEDEAVDADDVALGTSDTVTGTTTLYIIEGSYIYDVIGSSNIVPVFEAHDAEFELAD